PFARGLAAEQRRCACTPPTKWRPRGGVVTQRTANPRTPVRFRPWPPQIQQNQSYHPRRTSSLRDERRTSGRKNRHTPERRVLTTSAVFRRLCWGGFVRLQAACHQRWSDLARMAPCRRLRLCCADDSRRPAFGFSFTAQ